MAATETIVYAELNNTPVGKLVISGDGDRIQRVFMHDQKYAPEDRERWRRDNACYQQAIEQLRAYFVGELTAFDLPLNPQGTEFQKKVWQALTEIPFGVTCSYHALAHTIGASKAVRAVGAANGRNPIGIIVPCHRVIGASGKLTGYAGGLRRKQWLLEHERCYSLQETQQHSLFVE